MRRLVIAAIILPALLLAACGGSEAEPPAPTAAPEIASTATIAVPTEPPAPTAEPTIPPTPTAVPPTLPASETNFPPGTRIETSDPLPAGAENAIVLLANRGDVLIAGADPVPGQDIALGLFYLTGSGPGQLVNQVNAGPGFEQLAHAFEAAGAYRLAIRDMTGVDGSYVLRLAGTPGLAFTVEPRFAVSGMLEVNGSLSFLHNGYAGQTLTLSALPLTADLDLRLTVAPLLEPANLLLEADASGAGEEETGTLDLSADGEYLITVTRNGETQGAFDLVIDLR